MKNSILIILLLLSAESIGQTRQLSFGVTPNLTSGPKVTQGSPADIYGKKKLNFQAQLLFNYIPVKSVGFVMGVNAGILNWTTSLKAPRNAFGTMMGAGDIDFTMYSDDFFYVELMGGATKSGILGGVKYRLEMGPAIRYYPTQTELDAVGAAFNRATRYNPDDPNAGPPDLLIEIPPASHGIHPNIFATVLLPLIASHESHLEVGVSKICDLKPLRGKMIVRYNNTSYSGSFNPRGSYLGINVRYGFNVGYRSKSTK